jgi:SAM-dependent methyltransferase
VRVGFEAALRCPATGQPLELRAARTVDGRVEEGALATPDGRNVYPVRGGIPRFVPSENYASSFGLQWNRFRETQLDSRSGLTISRDRFHAYSGWTPDELRGARVLDAGCGAGRFTEIALAAGARVTAIDYSEAVDACRANHAGHPALEVVQADLYRLPFPPRSFDFVFCFGVLQHTPDVRGAFMAVAEQVAPGGRLAVDVYPRLARNVFWSKYWLRPVTKRLPTATLFRAVERAVPALLPLSRAVGRIPYVGRTLRYALPVVNYEGVYALSEAQLREWAVLDTFDMLAPEHDHPQSARSLRAWLEESGFRHVSVERMGFLVGRGRR